VVTKIQRIESQHLAAPIVRIKVHIKRIDIAVPLVVDNDGRCHGAIRLPAGVGLDALDPLRVRGHVVFGREVDVAAQRVQVVQVQRARRVGYGCEVDFGVAVRDLGADV
jgi:hypothetical protein